MYADHVDKYMLPVIGPIHFIVCIGHVAVSTHILHYHETDTILTSCPTEDILKLTATTELAYEMYV